jgi:hypothetical protein
MIKAYHYAGIGIEEILRQGVMLPGMWHFHPDDIKESCLESSLKQWEQNVSRRSYWDPEKRRAVEVKTGGVSRIGLQAVKEAINDLVEYIREFQAENGVEPERSRSPGLDITCEDLLAGEHSMIFFSPYNWSISELPNNGIVLDAEELVRRGASVRYTDMNRRFNDAIERVLGNLRWNSLIEAKSALTNDLLELGAAELSGKEAIEHLRSEGTEDTEIVWEGPLDLADFKVLEIWKDEKKVPVGRWGDLMLEPSE